MKTEDYHIKVTTKARQAGVTEQPDGSLTVKVHAAPDRGRANQAVTILLAEHFGVAQSNVELRRGLTSRNKLVRIHRP